jgi:NNP family nitrate/nitrite transporter-like MFS transporter
MSTSPKPGFHAPQAGSAASGLHSGGHASFLKSGHLPTLAMSFAYFDVSFMVWVLIGVLGVHISADFGLTPGQKGLLVAIPILGGALVRIPLGVLVDKFGPRKTGLIAQAFVILPLLWGWLGAKDMRDLTLLGLLLGIAGGSFAVALPLASRWYPAKHQGLAMGIAGAGNSGTVLAALLAPRLAESHGWHAVFGLALIPVVAVLAAFSLLAKDSPAQPGPLPFIAYLHVCKQPDLGWFSLLYAFTFGGFVGMASFLVIFFHDQYGQGKVMAGNFTALCVCAGSFLRPVGGYLADRLGGVRMLGVLLAGLAVCLTGLALLPSLPVAVGLLFLTMAMLGMGNGSVFQLVPQRFRNEIGVATGVVGAAGGLGGFVLPYALGRIKDLTGSYGTGLFLFGLTGLACLILLQLIKTGWHGTWLPKSVTPVPAPALADR